MTPLNVAVIELRLTSDRCYTAALKLIEQREVEGRPVSDGQLQDHRVFIVGELLDAIDRIDPGLGDALLKALYPFTNDDPDFTSVEVPR